MSLAQIEELVAAIVGGELDPDCDEGATAITEAIKELMRLLKP
jgi:hypothetical protein